MRRPFAIFPCNGKVPLTPHGCKDATTDREQIREWEERWPACNWAVATGSASGGLVDVDGIWDDPGAAWTRLVNECGLNGAGGLQTVTVLSGSGHSMHWYFMLPSGVTLGNSTGRLAAGIDTRGEGGYVICQPSAHPESGGRYEWVISPDEYGIVQLPAGLLEQLLPLPRPAPPPPRAAPLATGALTPEGQRRLLGIVRRVESAAKGERHDVLFWAACRIADLVSTNHVDGGLGEEALRAAVDSYGLTSAELLAAERTIRDGLGIGGAA